MNKKIIEQFLKKNSTTILTVVGSCGVVATAVESAKDTLKMVQRFKEELPVTNKKKFEIAFKCYIPTMLIGVSTILCICGSNIINKNIQKSLVSAYMMIDQSYKKYRESTKEVYGKDGETKIIKNMSENNEPYTNTNENSDEDVFFDFYSMQFFKSKLSKVAEGERIANRILKSQGFISLNDVYNLIGEPEIKTCELLGWAIGKNRSYEDNCIDIETTLIPKDDGTKYYVVDFINGPTNDYMDQYI